MTEYEDAEGAYQHEQKSVEVELVDGSTRQLTDNLRAVLDMWIGELKAMGFLPRLQPAAARATQGMPPRQTSSGAGAMNFVARKGERFRVQFRRQKYNYARGRIELSRSPAANVMNIFPPELKLSWLTNNRTGQRLERTIKLSPDESAAYRVTEDRYRAAGVQGEIAPNTASSRTCCARRPWPGAN